MEECFLVSFDYTNRGDKTCATIMKEDKKGYSLVQTLYGEEAEALFLQLTGKHIEDSQKLHRL